MLDFSKCIFDDSWCDDQFDSNHYVQTYYFIYTEFYSNGLFDKYKDDDRLVGMELKLEVCPIAGRLTSNLSMAACIMTEGGYSDEDWTVLVPGRDYDDAFLSKLFKLANEGPLDRLADVFRDKLKMLHERVKEINNELEKRI